MVLLLHIIIASISIASTIYTGVSPSKSKLYATYALVASTLISGFYLLFTTPSHMVSSCMVGLAYIGFVSYSIVRIHHKLATQEVQ